MRDTIKVVIVTLLFSALVFAIFFFSCTQQGVRQKNQYVHGLRTADDETNYETLKEVENTCRAMISSYNSDKLVYEQYKNSEIKEEQNWANQAKMRANNTASTYNNYILKNNYVWKNDVPSDIYMNLSYLD